jgi:hypothetical protein
MTRQDKLLATCGATRHEIAVIMIGSTAIAVLGATRKLCCRSSPRAASATTLYRYPRR